MVMYTRVYIVCKNTHIYFVLGSIYIVWWYNIIAILEVAVNRLISVQDGEFSNWIHGQLSFNESNNFLDTFKTLPEYLLFLKNTQI